MVLVVTDVLVSPTSVVTELESDWEFVDHSPLFSPKKRSFD